MPDQYPFTGPLLTCRACGLNCFTPAMLDTHACTGTRWTEEMATDPE